MCNYRDVGGMWGHAPPAGNISVFRLYKVVFEAILDH